MKHCFALLLSIMICSLAHTQTNTIQKIIEKQDVEYAYPRWSRMANAFCFKVTSQADGRYT